MTKINDAIRYAADRGYTVDQCGNVYGVAQAPLKLMVKQHTRMSYLSFSVGDVKVKVHRFVAYLKYGRRALRKRVHVRHRDGNSFNNGWGNVLLGTQSQNEMDKPAEKRRALGLKNAKHLPRMWVNREQPLPGSTEAVLTQLDGRLAT